MHLSQVTKVYLSGTKSDRAACRLPVGMTDTLGESRPYIHALKQRGSERLAEDLAQLKSAYNVLQEEQVRWIKVVVDRARAGV